MDMKPSESIKKVCFVLPTFNEADNIRSTIESIFLEKKHVNKATFFILIVDDNSPDGTQQIVKDLMGQYQNLKMITGEKKGLGEAYKRGFDYALSELDADIIFQMDSDGQHDSKLIPHFLRVFEQGFDLIIGSRFVEGGSTPEFSLRRKILSKVGNLLVRYVGGVAKIKDCTSGYRCIRASFLKRDSIKSLSARGYSFQSSLVCELTSQGAKTKEIPITFTRRLSGESKLSWEDQVEFIMNIPRLGFRNYQDFIRYAIVGVSGVFVNLGIYYILTRFLGISQIVSPIISIECAVLSNFILNNFWTFKGRNLQESFISKLFKFHSIAALSGATNYGVFIMLISIFTINDLVANLFGILLGAILNYLINSNWTWRKFD